MAIPFAAGSKGDGHATPPERVNRLLTSVFALEGKVLGRIRFPIGLSLFAVARKAPA